MGKAKGSVIVYTREYVQRRLGDDGWAKVLAASSEPQRAFLESVVLASSFYPVEHWNDLLAVVLPMLGPNVTDAMRELSGYIAHQDLSTVYKLVMKFGSPEFLLRRTGQLWSRYYDTGSLTPEEVSPKVWRIVLSAPTGREAAPDAFTCGPGVSAWVASGLSLSGTKARVVETRCRFRGAPRCEFDVTW